VTTLAVDVARPSILFAGTPNGVFRSGDAGQSWAVSDASAAFESVTGLAIDAVSPGTVYASYGYAGPSPGGIPRGGLIKTLDGGATWSEVSSPFLYASVSAVLLDPQRHTTV
jgi:hypothetical protein